MAEQMLRCRRQKRGSLYFFMNYLQFTPSPLQGPGEGAQAEGGPEEAEEHQAHGGLIIIRTVLPCLFCWCSHGRLRSAVVAAVKHVLFQFWLAGHRQGRRRVL